MNIPKIIARLGFLYHLNMMDVYWSIGTLGSAIDYHSAKMIEKHAELVRVYMEKELDCIRRSKES